MLMTKTFQWSKTQVFITPTTVVSSNSVQRLTLSKKAKPFAESRGKGAGSGGNGAAGNGGDNFLNR